MTVMYHSDKRNGESYITESLKERKSIFPLNFRNSAFYHGREDVIKDIALRLRLTKKLP